MTEPLPFTPTETERAHVLHLVEMARQRLLMQVYTIDVDFVEQGTDDDDSQCLAEYVSNFPYLFFTVQVKPLFFRREPARQERTIVHELAHAIVQPLLDAVWQMHSDKLVTWPECKKRSETLVDHIAAIVCRDRLQSPESSVNGTD